jgi:hypothetical protein
MGCHSDRSCMMKSYTLVTLHPSFYSPRLMVSIAHLTLLRLYLQPSLSLDSDMDLICGKELGFDTGKYNDLMVEARVLVALIGTCISNNCSFWYNFSPCIAPSSL